MSNNWQPESKKSTGIYKDKDQSLPRFIYRRVFHDISNAKSFEERKNIIRAKFQEIINCKKGDALKMKWILPAYIKDILDNNELSFLNEAIRSRKKIKRSQSALIFPHCADEFDLCPEFYEAAFGDIDLDPIRQDALITTLGSCFARNISFHLAKLGYRCENLAITEDMNSPMSNLELIRLCLMNDNDCDEYLEDWNERFFNTSESLTRNEIAKFKAKDKKAVQKARARLRASNHIILTFGNILNFACVAEMAQRTNTPPRFLRLFQSEDIGFRMNYNGAMKSLGYELKAFSYESTLEASKSLIDGISKLNPNAKILLTLSPVPIDNALGIKSNICSSVTLDCYSKSILRSCIQNLLDTNYNVKYFPSFEIVRWLAPVTGTKVFGEEDAASRHVSEKVLLSIYNYFVSLIND